VVTLAFNRTHPLPYLSGENYLPLMRSNGMSM
jgi:hypothetical protein